jgi:hypothetical protein
MNVKKIESLCEALAVQIELAGIESGVPFGTCQNQYGVTWEYLTSQEWIGQNNLDSAVEEIEAVRFVDCDGERSDSANSVCEILEAAKSWIEANEDYCDE